MPPLRVLELSGSHYQMGFTHGQAYRDAIREYTEGRIRLAMSDSWTGHALSREEVLALAQACIPAHQAYAPELMEEIQGLADATGLSPAELIITNGFTDFIDLVYAHGRVRQAAPQAADDCTAFIVPDSRAKDGHGFLGQTWDMHADSTRYVILLRCRPDGEPACLTFTVMGCIGMIGMNEAGIAVGINNLVAADGQVGVTWPFVVRKILQQTDLDAALDCITRAPLVGAHNYLLFDRTGRGYNVEAFPTATHVTPLADAPIVHTNHCLVPATQARSRPRLPQSQASSEARLDRAACLLSPDGPPVDVDDLMALTRDEVICVRARPPLEVESCGAAIMRPATGDFWAVWGLPAENEYEHFQI